MVARSDVNGDKEGRKSFCFVGVLIVIHFIFEFEELFPFYSFLWFNYVAINGMYAKTKNIVRCLSNSTHLS